MKNVKQWKYFLIAMVSVGLSTAFGDTLIGQWNMSGTPVTKTVDSIMSDTGYPSGGFVSESRTVLEFDDGDVVYGKPRQNATAFPELSPDAGGASGLAGDTSMLNKGALAQSFHIGEVVRPIENAFKVKFDFKLYDPAVWIYSNSMTILMDGGMNRFSIRLTTVSDGTGKIQFYCFSTAAQLLETPFTVNMSDWNHLECWLQNGVMNVKLNDDAVVTKPFTGTLATRTTSEYCGLTVGARWDGGRYYSRAYFDNIELYTLIEGCGSWGYLPTDFNKDCIVDIDDLAYLVAQWLVCTDPQGEDCVDVLAQ